MRLNVSCPETFQTHPSTSLPNPGNGQVIETSWRKICTPIPVPESLETIERLRAVEPRSMRSMPPIVWHEAEGFLVRDPYGNQWIDLTSGIVATNSGHGHPRIREAIAKASQQGPLFSYAFTTIIRTKMLEKLIELSPIDDAKAILFNAGTEATECTMMLMRRHGLLISPEKVGIVSFEDGFHGRTLAASLAAGVPGPNDWIAREKVAHYQIPFPFCPQCPWKRELPNGSNDGCQQCGAECFAKCLESLAQRNIKPQQIAGIIAEPMPGWATWPLPKGFAQAMFAWAKKHDILITFDEVQSGSGRTGRFLAFEQLDVVPDLITMGKGLSSSLPVSAVIGRREIMDISQPGEMSSTHGGNPVCVSAALANLQVIEEESLMTRATATGAAILKRLEVLANEYPQHILSAHGQGLFISLHLKDPKTGKPDVALADAIVEDVVRRGVLMFTTSRGFLKIAPPLCIETEAALEAIEVICDRFAANVTKS